MTVIPEDSKGIYESKDAKKTFDALEQLTTTYSHAPKKGEQRVRCYHGYYSKASRGKRKKQNQDEWMPCILESDDLSKEKGGEFFSVINPPPNNKRIRYDNLHLC